MKNVARISRRWKTISVQFSPLLLCFMLTLIAALFLGVTIGATNPIYGVAAAGAIVMVIIMLLRLDELTVTIIFAVHLYIDWFLGLHLIGVLLSLILLFVFYFWRSIDRPWIDPRSLWLWAPFLLMTIYPAVYGGQLRLYDLATFYPSNILGAFIMFWLGTIVIRDRLCLQRFLKMLAGLGILLAIHTIIQSTTGVLLFGTSRVNDILLQAGDYQLAANSASSRAGSFLIDPNWNGTLLAVMAFFPLGLFFVSSTLLWKVFYFFGTILMFLALLFTYSNGGWVGAITGLFIFILLAGRKSHSFLILSFIVMLAIILVIFFPTEVSNQLQHASNPNEVTLRVEAWHTALQTIQAFPLTGVGLGYQAYLLGTQPFNALEKIAYSQPHDSYLEWAAMAGIPVLLVFVALLLFTLWMAWSNWVRADVHTRSLIGCGIAAIVSLSMSSITINGWTHPVIAEVGWLILGAITSPLLAKSLGDQMHKGKVML